MWIGFVDFMLIGKSLLDYSNLLSPNDYEKNDKKNTKIFSIAKKLWWKNYVVLFVTSIKKLKVSKYIKMKTVTK